MKNYKTREEIPAKYKWDLKQYFKSDEDFQKELKSMDALFEKFLKYETKVAESADTLYEVLDLNLEINRKISNLYSYASQSLDENTRDPKYQELKQKVMSTYVEFDSKSAFFVPEIIEAGREKIMSYVKSNSKLAYLEKYLDDILRNEPHTLTAKEEKILATLGEVFNGPTDAFGMLNNADFVFPELTKPNGEKVRLTHGNAAVLLMDKDRNFRKQVAEARISIYKDYQNTLASLYSSQVKTQAATARIKNFNSSREASLFRNNIPVKIYDTLIEKVNSRMDLMGRFIELKKKALNYSELHGYDMMVPVVEGGSFEMEYEDACENLLQALKPMGDDYVNSVKRAFDENWIDVYETPGKRSGAYSGGTYDSVPYILLNYQDQVSDAFTLAHEMGHSMHSHYSRSNQKFAYGGYCIFLAEIASTFNESLFMHHLVNKETDKKRKMFLISDFLDTIKGTLFRQTQFAEFEKISNEIVEKGGALTADLLAKTYRELNEKYHPGLEKSEDAGYGWSVVPHFYYNYYVFQYATGISAALSLSKAVLEGKEGALDKYYGFLKAGSSKYPVDVLKEAGVDMITGEAIDDALSVFEDYLDKFEALLTE